MTTRKLWLRRTATTIGVVAALVLGYGSIRAAATWTASTAPLTVAPVSVSVIQDRLALERARSADMESRLQGLAAQSVAMTAALEAAQARITADTDHAKALAKELQAAKKKLAKLEASIAKARRAAAHPQVVVTTTKTVTAASKHHGDDGEGDDHEGGDD